MIARLILRDVRRGFTGAAWLPIAFFLLVATLVPFAVGADARLLGLIGPGILWIAALLSSLLGNTGGNQANSCTPGRSSNWFRASSTSTTLPRAAAWYNAPAKTAYNSCGSSGTSTVTFSRRWNSPSRRRSRAGPSALAGVEPM